MEIDTALTKKESARLARANREEMISSFFDEIDSGKINQFRKEDSYRTYLETIRFILFHIQ